MTVLALSLFVFWILADYSDASFSFNDFTFFTDRFYRCSNFHWNPPFPSLGHTAQVVSLYGISSFTTHRLQPIYRCGERTSIFSHKKIALHRSSIYIISVYIEKCKCYFMKFPSFFKGIFSKFYLSRQIIRPFVKSYGDSSIVTLSPGKIRI